jgi:hypothetical protein
MGAHGEAQRSSCTANTTTYNHERPRHPSFVLKVYPETDLVLFLVSQCQPFFSLFLMVERVTSRVHKEVVTEAPLDIFSEARLSLLQIFPK